MRFASVRFASLKFAPARFASLRSASYRSGRMSGFSSRHAFHAATPCLSNATCSSFAIEHSRLGSAPVLFLFPLHRRCRRILEFEPIGRAAGAVSASPAASTRCPRCSFRGSPACAGFAYSHLVILSADKELFLQDRCRRSARNGYRCRPDGPWRGERIPGQGQTPRLLPPMETAEESVHERQASCTRWPRLHHSRTRCGHSNGLTVWPLPQNFRKTEFAHSRRPCDAKYDPKLGGDYAETSGLQPVRRVV